MRRLLAKSPVVGRLAPVMACCAVLAACSNVEKAKPQPQPSRVSQAQGFEIDVPLIMRGTVASETVVLGYADQASQGYRPVVARGFGLVVGLKGTGSRDIPPQLRAYMLQQAALGGFGSEKYGQDASNISPEELLNSPDSAVVVVEAVVPQGAKKATQFDVRVYADPRTGTTSLEGGILYTTDLRPGPLSMGGQQAFALAKAHGPIFVNPFAEPGAVGRDTVARTAGRILNGGVVTKDMPLKLRLGSPGHTRAATIVTAINTRFPQEPGQRDPTARGESDASIEITVPPSYFNRTDEFIELLRHTTISQANPEGAATYVRRVLESTPIVAEAASWRWRAIGPRALPIIRELYDHPAEAQRMAALRAGAGLSDPMVTPALTEMAANGSITTRLEAIDLLGEMADDPRIDRSLRAMLDDNDVEVRLRSYEALAKRGDPLMRRFNIDGKYILDVVESSKPLIYISQVGMPRIVLFGVDTPIRTPVTMTAWSDRLIVKGDPGQARIEAYYRPEGADRGMIVQFEPTLVEFAKLLGHTTTVDRPGPGIGLSYGETVGALYELWKQKYVNVDFKAEQDRILAAIVRREEQSQIEDRPEFSPTSEDSESDEGWAQPTSDIDRLQPAGLSQQAPTGG